MDHQRSNVDANLNWSWELEFLNNELKLVLQQFKGKEVFGIEIILVINTDKDSIIF